MAGEETFKQQQKNRSWYTINWLNKRHFNRKLNSRVPRFSQRFNLGFRSSGLWLHVSGYFVSEVSKETYRPHHQDSSYMKTFNTEGRVPLKSRESLTQESRRAENPKVNTFFKEKVNLSLMFCWPCISI